MEIIGWSDFLCSFSYMSTMGLKKAYEETGAEVNYTHKAKCLMAGYRNRAGLTSGRNLMPVLETDEEGVKEKIEELMGDGLRRAGVTINLEAILFDSKPYHKLIYIAEQKDRAWELTVRIYEDYYLKGLDLREGAFLGKYAKEYGLGEDAPDRAFEDKALEERFTADEKEFEEMGAKTIPYYIINGEKSPGSKSVDRFVEILQGK